MFEGLRVSAFLAWKSIQRGSKGTLALTIMIVALIFVNLVFLPSIISGVVKTFDDQSINFDFANLVIEPREGSQYIDGVTGLQKKVERIPGITGTSPRIAAGVTYFYRGRNTASTLYGITPEDERSATKIADYMTEGEFLSNGDTDAIVMGVTLAGQEGEEAGGLPSLQGVVVGDSVEVAYPNGETRTYRVKGIYKTQSFGVDTAAFVTSREMSGVLGLRDQASMVLVKTEVNGREDDYKMVLLSYGIQEEIRTYQEKSGGFVDQAIQSFNIINAISTLVSLIIAVVVVFIVIFINTVNRRRQIGILKAIGIDQQIIINSYVLQVLFITAVGALAGMALAAGVMAYLTAYPLVFPGGPVYPVVEVQAILRSIASLFAVSVVAGYIPAWQIAGEDILTAIRG
ncbi:FtsX-like permease family protein [Methanoculleus bourgensis]|jgi:putative ABC transport system permease protein|uniref:ABC transporter, permease protein n=1 Tax=Methanoculleus bourgensis (strain ATCC 43281 / DSM 3045 / OCM 15 / MS2) TaxID=1201294 RepID=I7LJT9_METBM|nr:FtsX-like permease family protein [Methanoculleus bourgensis]MBT0732871.1 FtsX-like permease family protein [Methanoculleus bourgensis]NQS74781.1 FtsX-like permease family protein [Methanoculleus sp.]CCJ36332.2 putative ABC transporter, permease protein [Methanoculleus bourgensis MS2]SAI87336.1 putative ABC transporter, permease protein [Methanoculleus bourgensis]